MAAAASDRTARWEPFGVTEADFAAVPERDGVRVVNVTPGAGGPGPGQAGWWLRGAAVALGVLAAAAAAVSWDAQYAMVRAVKPVPVVAALEAGIPDVGAVVFAALGVALALHGKRAVRTRALNAACIGISLGMNALAAGRGWRNLAIWVMPAAVYAVASDTLIAVIRAWVLARARHPGEALADDGLTPLAAVAGLALWLLRLSLAPRSTLTGFRSWVLTDCPVAPGLRPGHLAQVEAARQDADQRVALAAREHDEALEQAAATARPATRRRGHAPRRPGSGPSSTGPAPTRASSSRRPSPMRPGNAATCAPGPDSRPGGCRPNSSRCARTPPVSPGTCGIPPPPGSPPWRRRPPGSRPNATSWPRTSGPQTGRPRQAPGHGETPGRRVRAAAGRRNGTR